MKYLIAALGNIGSEYDNTRHNAGFSAANHLAQHYNAEFHSERLGNVASIRLRGRTILLLEPSTYMNNSGRAVAYWLNREKIPLNQLLVLSDDIALPLGTLRMRPSGSHGGHNGLRSIIEHLCSEQFARLRIGVGNDYERGNQIDYVLGKWHASEQQVLSVVLERAALAVVSFVLDGLPAAMNKFNRTINESI